MQGFFDTSVTCATSGFLILTPRFLQVMNPMAPRGYSGLPVWYNPPPFILNYQSGLISINLDGLHYMYLAYNLTLLPDLGFVVSGPVL